MLSTTISTRSNRSIFIIEDTGSPQDALVAHVASLGQIGRLDFERCATAGEVVYAVEGDLTPMSQQDEDARIGSLAYALNKFRNPADAAEFTRCLNAICEDGDALSRQATAGHYYNEIGRREVADVLKEMGLLAMRLESLHSQWEVTETDPELNECTEMECGPITSHEGEAESIEQFFAREVTAIARMTRGGRRSASFAHDEAADWINDLEANGASVEEMDRAFILLEAMDQYDEGGAILLMSSHERTVACGRIDAEITAEDLPLCARHLAGELRQAYVSGVSIESIWEEIDAQLEFLFPVSGRTADGARFYSHVNRELRSYSRQCLEALLDDCRQDFHLNALRSNENYRSFHKEIRAAVDTKNVSEIMKQAFAARQSGTLSVKQLVALKTAAQLQRVRLQSAPLSIQARALIREIENASEGKLRFLSWAFYGTNQPVHPMHSLTGQEASAVWEALKTRKRSFADRRRVA